MAPRLIALLAMIAATMFAQSEKATLRGSVTDPSGAVVAGASIVVTEIATNVEARRAASDAAGNFEIPELKPGAYRITIDQAGFRRGTG